MTRRTNAELEAEVQELRERLRKLEALVSAPAAPPAPPAVKAAPVVSEGVTPEIVLAITAAVAAFLGKRATIRQIHLVGSSAWAQQGRATVQASHSLIRGYR